MFLDVKSSVLNFRLRAPVGVYVAKLIAGIFLNSRLQPSRSVNHGTQQLDVVVKHWHPRQRILHVGFHHVYRVQLFRQPKIETNQCTKQCRQSNLTGLHTPVATLFVATSK